MLEELAELGLTGEVTPQQIKRAYLRKVKEHSPERDPEGFQRVRRAYEAALAGLGRQALDARESAVRAAEGQSKLNAPRTEPLPSEAAPAPPPPSEAPESPPPSEAPESLPPSEAPESPEAARAPQFPAFVSEQIALLNRALEDDDPDAAAAAMIELFTRPALEEAPVPPAIFALRTFMVLAEGDRFVLARRLLEAFEHYVTSHHVALGAGGELSARWRLAREVLATSELDGRLAASLALGLRRGRLFEAASAAREARIRSPRTLEPHMRSHAPTLWASVEPLLVDERAQSAPPAAWSFSGASLWPVGLIILLVVNLARLCGPGGHSSSRDVSYAPRPAAVPERESPSQGHPAETAPSGSALGAAHWEPPSPRSPADAADLRRDGSWMAISVSLSTGDCEGVRAQWPTYRVLSAGAHLDERLERSRRQQIMRRCAELAPLVDPQQ